MTRHPNDQMTPSSDIAPSQDDQRSIHQSIAAKPAIQQVRDVQVDTINVAPVRVAASNYARIEAAAWASDMYDICGGDGESNAYLGDGISITPDGHLVDD